MRLATPFAAFAALACAGCVSVLPEPKAPDALYRIGPVEAAHALPAPVLIREPDAPALMAGRAIAAEDASGALRLIPGVEWSERATRMLQTGLLDALSGQGGAPALAEGSGARADYELAWRVRDFTVSDGEARCRLRLMLMDATGAARSSADVDETRRASGRSGPARAQALAAAARGCIAAAAGFVARETAASAES